jgi:general secretion pathway protein D
MCAVVLSAAQPLAHPVVAGENGAGSASVPGGIAGVAAAEAQRRQQRVAAAQTLFTAGSRAYADQSYGEAMDNFKAAFETIPDVPAVASQRLVFFKRYQSAAYRYAVQLAEEAKWAESEKTLDDIVLLAEQGGVEDFVVDPEVRKMREELKNRDDRYNMATTPQHLRNVELVKSKLILANGFMELGDYDRAERTYNQVLAADAFNNAARRGLEEVERYRMNYYDAAFDHTRAKKLAEVVAGWESPVPPVLNSSDFMINGEGVTDGGRINLEQKMKQISIPSLEFNGATLGEVIDFLIQTSQELDAAEVDPLKKGVNFVIDSSGLPNGEDAAQRQLSVKLSNVPLEVAVKYVAQQVRMTYRIDNFAVRIIPEDLDQSGVLISRSYTVPPGFLSGGGGQQGGADAAVADPFAVPDSGGTGGGALVKRITAQEFLEQRGVQFGTGASATYIVGTNALIVRNTPQQMETIDYIVQAAKDISPKMVQIHVKMISVESVALQQAGLDFLLGQSNLGSSPRVFFGGGTDGNASLATESANFPFNGPSGPVGTYPVTSGLRTGSSAGSGGIDYVLNRDSPSPVSSAAPGVFSVAGVFTDPQFQLVLRALSQMKGSDLLCDSYVSVVPGQLAKLEQVREFIYPTEYDPPEIPNDFGNPTINGVIYIGPADPIFPATPATPTAFETRKLGKTIELEPTVSSDNRTVNVNVLMDFTEFSGFINYGTPITNGAILVNGAPSVVTDNEILMPVFDAIKETTNVSVWDGQTIAIGGFHGESVSDVEDKIPFLGDLPVIGRGFRSSTSETAKRALTIFVTVRLVDPGGNPINVPEEEVAPEFVRQENVPPRGYSSGPPPGMVYPDK